VSPFDPDHAAQLPPQLRSATALRRDLLCGAISSRELVTAAIRTIERLDPALSALVVTDFEAALAAAEAADARFSAGTARPLEGLPVTIKDSFAVAGLPTACGIPALKDYRPAEDAAAVSRLRAAGAIVLGKTNVPLLTADLQTFNAVYGATSNPWNLAYSPGGSSGGAAVAVSTGMAAFELGSDLAGSIRWPAHCCGLFGLKTTSGAISTVGHIPPLPDQVGATLDAMAVAGPIARSAADLELVLDVLMPRVVPPARGRAPRASELRIAVWSDDPFSPVESAVAEAVERAAHLLESAGARIDRIARPAVSFAECWEVFALFCHKVVAAAMPGEMRTRIAATAPSFAPTDKSHRALQARALALEPAELAQLEARRHRLVEACRRFFESFDALLCPPAATGAIVQDSSPDPFARQIRVGAATRPYFDLMHWVALASVTGLPAAVAPIFLAADKLPRGVQIIAASGEDRAAVTVASLLEELGPRLPPPPIIFA
jgi:amidase